MSRIDEIMDSHSLALEKLTTREAREFVKTYRSVARDLQNQIVNARSDDAAQRARIMLAQVGRGIADLEIRLGGSLDHSVHKAKLKAIAHLVKTIKTAEPVLGETVGSIEVEALRRFQRDLAIHRFSIRTYGQAITDALQREIIQSTAMGEGVTALEKRLRSTLVGSKLESRAWLIARMELSRAYNDATMVGITEANSSLPGGMMKRIHDVTDIRNHPFSRATHGVVAKSGQPFKVPAAEVFAAGAAMGKGVGGILWPRKGAYFVGMNLPAHFGERGRIVPWREEWDEGAKAKKKAEEDAEAAREKTEKEAAEKVARDKRNARRRAARAAKKAAALKRSAQPTFAQARAALVAAEDAATALGLNPHQYAASRPLEIQSLEKMREAAKHMASTPGSPPWRDARRVLRKYAPAGEAAPTLSQVAKIASVKEAKLAARDAVGVAYRELVKVAPRGWQEKERLRWYKTLLQGNGPRVPRAHRERYDRALATALRQFRPDQLRLLAADGEKILHTAGHARAHAHPRWGVGHAQHGFIKQDLRRLFGNYKQSAKAADTLAHELGHRLDGIMSGRVDATTGWPWKSRPGYPDAPKHWRDAFGTPYEAAKTGGIDRLAYRESSSPFHWTGNWVNPYEARIYSGRASERGLTAHLRTEAGAAHGNAGPVEFIAMANSYRTTETFSWIEATTRHTSSSARKVWHNLNQTIGGSQAADQSTAMVAARLHGPAYRDALENLYGDGLRLAEEMATRASWGPPGLSRDQDLTATAVLLHGRLGTPLEKSLGPTGPLGKLLSKPAKLDQIQLTNPALRPSENSAILLRVGGSKTRDST